MENSSHQEKVLAQGEINDMNKLIDFIETLESALESATELRESVAEVNTTRRA